MTLTKECLDEFFKHIPTKETKRKTRELLEKRQEKDLHEIALQEFLAKVIVIDDDKLSQKQKNSYEMFIHMEMKHKKFPYIKMSPTEVTYESLLGFCRAHPSKSIKKDPLFIEIISITRDRFNEEGYLSHAKIFDHFLPKPPKEAE